MTLCVFFFFVLFFFNQLLLIKVLWGKVDAFLIYHIPVHLQSFWIDVFCLIK